MIKHTFQHLPGVRAADEEEWWKRGLLCWEDACRSDLCSADRRELLEESEQRLEARDARYFADNLTASERWRLYTEFFEEAAFLDIETTGLGADSYTTMAGVLDKSGYRAFIRGDNLDELPEALAEYRLVVTFNGLAFDVPFLRREFGPILPNAAHMDLMYVLRRLGFKGGLKRVEQTLRVGRPSILSSLSGRDAVLLWQMAQEGEPEALQTLIRYNAEDVVSLPKLAAIAVSEHAVGTPMAAVAAPKTSWFDPESLPFDASLVHHIASLTVGRW
ncbi:MAG: ribonuclease H-like domain-containing protein [Dehalococcoidia bacterium]